MKIYMLRAKEVAPRLREQSSVPTLGWLTTTRDSSFREPSSSVGSLTRVVHIETHTRNTFNNFFKLKIGLGMVAHLCHPSSLEAEAGTISVHWRLTWTIQ